MARGRKKRRSNTLCTSFDNDDCSENASPDVDPLERIKKDIIQALSTEINKLKDVMLATQAENRQLKHDITTVKRENLELRDQLTYNKNKINDLEQYSRRNSIRIFGLPEESNESNYECLCKVLNLVNDRLQVSMNENDIDAIHRTGTNRDGRPRGVIIKFVRRTLKEKVMSSKKMLKGSGFVITEDLTKNNLALFHAVKDNTNVLHAWTVNGKVFAIKDDGSKIEIDNKDQINDRLPAETTRKITYDNTSHNMEITSTPVNKANAYNPRYQNTYSHQQKQATHKIDIVKTKKNFPPTKVNEQSLIYAAPGSSRDSKKRPQPNGSANRLPDRSTSPVPDQFRRQTRQVNTRSGNARHKN